MIRKMTMRAARINAGYTVKEAAAYAGIGEKRLRALERDNRKCLFDDFCRLCDLYRVSAYDIYIGAEATYLEKLRNRPLRYTSQYHADEVAI